MKMKEFFSQPFYKYDIFHLVSLFMYIDTEKEC